MNHDGKDEQIGGMGPDPREWVAAGLASGAIRGMAMAITATTAADPGSTF